MLFFCLIAFGASAQTGFTDFDAMKAAMTGQLRSYMQANPGHQIDSVKHHVIDDLTDGPVASKSILTKPNSKKLHPTKLYDKCKHSSLVFGKMEYAPALGVDTAYVNASAVALTPDGICATNYHVVSDVVLAGAMQCEAPNDRMRFVMDCDGTVYPLQRVLYIDPINDFSIIKVDTGDRRLVPAAIGSDPVQGETVFCLSHPSGYMFHFTEGIVSNRTQKTNPKNGQTQYVTEITAEYGVGASGGPIFDECGNLVGLVSSTFSLYGDPQQSRNFQMAFKQTVPVSLIKNCFTD